MKKRKGFILTSIVLLVLFILAIVTAINILVSNSSKNLVLGEKKAKAYYISRGGLNMVYSGLCDNIIGMVDDAKIKTYPLDKNILEGKTKDVELKDKDGNIVGYVDLELELKKGERISTDGNEYEQYYFVIYSNGKIKNTGNDKNNIKNNHKLTMFVFLDDPARPKIYDGYRKEI